MLVFYSLPNILSLPYPVLKKVEVKDDLGNTRLDKNNHPIIEEKEIPEYFNFVPGKNCISTKLWREIVKYNQEDWDYYSTIIKIFKPKYDEKNNIMIGEPEDKVQLSDLNTIEFKELIENTMDAEDLNKYKKFELGRDKQRKIIIDSIDSMLNEINLADQEINKAR